MLFNCLTVLSLAMLHNFQLAATQTCNTNEICVFEKLCPEQDDAGRGKIGPRTINVCGSNRICCDLNLLGATSIDDRINKDDMKRQTLVSTAPERIISSLPVAAYKSCGNNKECVPRYLCNGTINDSGRLIIRVGIRLNDLDGNEINDQSNNFGCTPMDKCCEIGDKLKEDPLAGTEGNFRYNGCGYSNPNGLFYTLENNMDDEAGFAEFPWIVAIMSGRDHYLCGGVLIHPKLVLTTAHSISNHTIDTLILRAGEWDLRTNNERLKHQNRRVKSIFIHEKFDNETLWNDIALLEVNEPFEMMPHVQPICLPAQETEESKKRLKQANCVASGWGHKDFYNETLAQSLLKRIDLPIVETGECDNLLRQTILGKQFWLRPSFLCAGGEYDKDTCRGDGGSPLSCSLPGNDNRFELTGLVSWGIGCGIDGLPGVYVNVPNLRSWIDKKSLELGLIIPGP